ncbi:ATP-binding protein [Floccifex sp.]|uniref:ATP-binding protein n=1 Tax=Floccifex sp. TaxID=2815810 RepID=UPI003F10FDAC
MKEFGSREYQKVAYISFYNNKRMADVFEMDYDIQRILMAFNIETGVTITPGDTLIILDEIQNAPKVLESLKYFCEDANEYHVMAAGSLLGVALHENVSYPVGKVDVLNLHPMSYRECLYAMEEEGLARTLESKDYNLIHLFSDKYIMWLKNYYYIGGMPEVVNYFSQTRDYKGVRDIQNSIVLQDKGDFGKHIGAKELPRINMVWESIPMQLAKENKKFFFRQIKKGARSSEFEVAIQWLQDSGLIYKVNKAHVPLSAYKDFSSYKLFMVDIGLLGALSGLDVYSILEGNEIFVEFKGALSEQFVLQQILSETDYIPYYFGTEKATFEQDFII